MPTANNVVHIESFKRSSRQEIIDDIGARAFLFLRDEAEQHQLPMKDIIAEQLLGLTLVIEAVEGTEEARRILEQVSSNLDCA